MNTKKVLAPKAPKAQAQAQAPKAQSQAPKAQAQAPKAQAQAPKGRPRAPKAQTAQARAEHQRRAHWPWQEGRRRRALCRLESEVAELKEAVAARSARSASRTRR